MKAICKVYPPNDGVSAAVGLPLLRYPGLGVTLLNHAELVSATGVFLVLGFSDSSSAILQDGKETIIFYVELVFIQIS